MYFKNREDAGKQLSQLLQKYKNQNVVVYALPRGGVVLGAEIAKALNAPLDLIFAHKIGHPYQPEYAIAAVSEHGQMVGNRSEIRSVDKNWFEREKEKQMREIKRRRVEYLKGKKGISPENKIAIIVDDGIATGLTMQAAILDLKENNASKIIVAVPMSPRSTAEYIRSMVDEFVGIEVPQDYGFLGAIGAYYEYFPQVEDDEVIDLLAKFSKQSEKGAKNIERLIHITHDNITLEGMLKIPQEAEGIVLFAHGSGSSRLSPRNNFVADVLNEGNLATLLIDLLSVKEDQVYETRFDIELLTERLIMVVDWLTEQPETKDLSIGLFGSSTGAAAALEVAAVQSNVIKAVVSRGGRPDLAITVLGKVTAPTLFIVGGNDFGVIELNEEAFQKLRCTKTFEIIPHATHLFEEPGCLEEVARLAQSWFKKHLPATKKVRK